MLAFAFGGICTAMVKRGTVSGKQDSQGPKTAIDKKQVKLNDLSIASESGHRELMPQRVSELRDLFLRGRYGRNLLMGPGIIEGQMDAMGRHVLEDGKHTVAALMECQQDCCCSFWVSSKTPLTPYHMTRNTNWPNYWGSFFK